MFPRKSAGFVVLAATVALTGVRAAANPGDLDPTFGTGGMVITSFGRSGVANAVAVQTDGKIVAAGGTGGLNGVHFAVSRYNEDGSLDGTFGTGGEVTTSFGGTYEYAFAVALQGDGKIVVVGFTSTGGAYRFALARYNGDGSLDGTFATAGQVTTTFGGNDLAGAVALQNDGKIVAAGVADGVFALARYDTDGSLDPTFGTAGQVATSFGGTYDAAPSVVLQGDGKIVAAGSTENGVGSAQFAAARYSSDGSLDGTFGTSGKVTTSFAGNDFANAVAVQGDGKIVAAGVAGPSSCPGTPCGSGNLFALARYNSDGSLDPSFGTGGQVTTNFGGTDAEAYSVALQGDGKIVAAGLTRTGSINRFALARYNGDGTLDATFGTGGQVTTSFGGTYDQALALALQGDGKIIAAGWTAKALGSAQFALARYLNDATSVTTTTTPSTMVTSTMMTSSTTTSTTSTTLGPKACRRTCRHEAKACAAACEGTRRTHRLCKRDCRNQRKNCGESTGCQLPSA
jgi:uncharacterized delta-60 repeat protein